MARIPDIESALGRINGKKIEARLNALARFAEGGDIGRGGTRLGLTHPEIPARSYLKTLFRGAGMRVREHPLVLVGYYPGLNPRKAPVIMESHFDTVPKAGKYDGPAGVMGAISVAEAFHKTKTIFDRPLWVVAFTLEESSAYNKALLGSQSMTEGLSERDLSLKNASGISLEEAIANSGYDPRLVREPIIKSKKPHAVVEMHIEQAEVLDSLGKQIGVVEAIAGTNRQQITIGDEPIKKIPLSQNSKGLEIIVHGQAGHSGGTPMGELFRADGLVPAAKIIEQVSAYDREGFAGVDINIQNIEIPGQALNKIPGETKVSMVVSGKNPDAVTDARQAIARIANDVATVASKESPRFSNQVLSVEELPSTQINQEQFDTSKMLPRYLTAAQVVMAVSEIANNYRLAGTVGTVGTFTLLPEGIMKLGIDIRGVNSAARTDAMHEIDDEIMKIASETFVETLIENFSSVNGTSYMDKKLISLITNSARELGLSHMRMPSGPGHDAQNFVARGIPTGMIFIPSRNGGMSHRPDEYSTPGDLENGARVMAMTVASLATI